MFLSSDGNTLTLFSEYSEDLEYSLYGTTTVMSIDVSDISEPKEIKRVTIGGLKKCVRKIGDQFYLVTNMIFRKNRIDLDDPTTYIPSIDYGDKTHVCDSSKIIFPEKISNVYYSYVTILNEGALSLRDEAALMTSGEVYFTENSIIFENSYSSEVTEGDKTVQRLFTRFGVLDMSKGLAWRGYFTVKGEIKDQYSIDERDGALRIVASTSDNAGYRITYDSASLYIYNLKSLEQIASVENFAPKGEAATAVRFEGDKLYVCTAEVVTYSDPVFFFDLSDYNNITYVDTGFIEGFSTSLIDFGEGYLLGVGRENGSINKLEVYSREGEKVVSVDKFYISGSMTTEYKSFLINREENLFGLYVSRYLSSSSNQQNSYVVVKLSESGKLTEVCRFDSNAGNTARAFAKDGFIYLTSNNGFSVGSVGGNIVCNLSTEHKLGEKTVIGEALCGELATYEQICSCGRSKVYQNYNPDRTTHTFSDDGICTNCGSDKGLPRTNADKIIYTSNGDGTCTVTGTRGWVYGVVKIPTYSPKGEKVSAIGAGAFSDCISLQSVTLPHTVTSIGTVAFYSCSRLPRIVIPESVTYIGSSAFENCFSLTIYCEQESKPSNWSTEWNFSGNRVVFGYQNA